MHRKYLFWALVCLLGAQTSQAAFSNSQQSGRALGLAGAVTARTTDPTAIFHNPGGLAYSERSIAVGLALTALNEGLFQGLSPGPAVGTAGAQDEYLELPFYIYYVKPIGDQLRVGMGIYTPFLLETEWDDPDAFSGRFLATSGQIQTYDFNPSIAWRLSPNIGIGGGLIYRISEVSAARRLGNFNPFTGDVVDVAALELESDFDAGIGWTGGILHRLGERLSWGFSYRSPIDIDYLGVGRLTQIETGNEQLDELIMASFPFDGDLALSTNLKFPARASAGVALNVGKHLLIEGDAEWVSWSRLEEIAFRFRDDDRFDTVYNLGFEDVLNLRVGLEWVTLTGSHYRLGVAVEESPQPDDTVGPFLADANRTVFSFGFGRDPIDVAFQWISYDQRTLSNNQDEFNGSYRRSAWILGLTFSK